MEAWCFADDIFEYVSFSEKFWMSIEIMLKFVPKGPVDKKSAVIVVMVWREQASSHYLNQWWPSSLMYTGLKESAINLYCQKYGDFESVILQHFLMIEILSISS